MKTTIRLLLLASAALLLPLSTTSGQTSGVGRGTALLLNDQDRTFVQAASEGLCFEIVGGNTALARTSTRAVRRYASLMVSNHSRDFDQLSRIGVRIGVALSATPSTDQRIFLGELVQLAGQEFDQKYVQSALKGHYDDIALYLKQFEKGKNPLLKRYASRHLSELFTHLQLAILVANVTGVPIQ